MPKGLQVHLILDNYATHKHADVRRWLSRHKRFHLHFTPTSSSWLNQVERWFRDLTDKDLRRGMLRLRARPDRRIEEYLTPTTTTPHRTCGPPPPNPSSPKSREPAPNSNK